jgi:predicted heme/steroid binding protein
MAPLRLYTFCLRLILFLWPVQDLWIAIDDKIYDLSNWADKHPGGEHLLQNVAGSDASAQFHAFHTPHGTGIKALKILKCLPHVANLAHRPKTPLEQVIYALPHAHALECADVCSTLGSCHSDRVTMVHVCMRAVVP